MTFLLDLNNSQNWTIGYDQTKETTDDRLKLRTAYRRLIDPFDIPVIFDSNVLACYASSDIAKPSWFVAGYLTQVVPNVLVNPGTAESSGLPTDAIVSEVRKIPLNTSPNLIIFNRVNTQTRCAFFPKPWIERFRLIIWEYTGTFSEEVIDEIQASRAKLEVMDVKLDTLLSNP